MQKPFGRHGTCVIKGLLKNLFFLNILYEAATAYKGTNYQFFRGYEMKLSPRNGRENTDYGPQVGASQVSQEDALLSAGL